MLHLFLDDRPWFKAKRYGLGAYPVAWQGWALTVAYVGLVGGLRMLREQRGGLTDAVWWSAFAVATLVFVVIAWRKTAGGWHWRWGRDDTVNGRDDDRRQPRDKHRERRR